MKLPQHYKRWPALRPTDTCDHMKGSLDTGFHACRAKAIAVVGAFHETEVIGFVSLCGPCFARIHPKGTILTNKEYRDRCRKERQRV